MILFYLTPIKNTVSTIRSLANIIPPYYYLVVINVIRLHPGHRLPIAVSVGDESDLEATATHPITK